MRAKNPSPASRSLGTLSHKGRGLKTNDGALPSPLVGEGGDARSALTGEGLLAAR